MEAKVRVGVRVRPLSSTEMAASSRPVLNHPARHMVAVGDGAGDKSFTYDYVFPSKMSQSDLFNSTAAPMMQSFLDGYNVTLIAYGQTGSGKTYTMGSEAGIADDQRGLIPRFLEEVFGRLQVSSGVGASMSPVRRKHEDTEVVVNPLRASEGDPTAGAAAPRVSVSFLEIYGEDIYDLLRDTALEASGKARSLPLREDSGTVSVVGLTEVPILEADEAMNQLRLGTLNRTTASTLMNTVSSRSHAVFTVTLHQTLFGDGHGEAGQEVVSKLSFVDLAGSERLKRTGAEGQRMKEGIQINKGLLALGNVINSLADEEVLKKKEKVHVGYRESKLTRLLQDALGGNSQTLFLACVSPAEVNVSETLSTLRYANRARNIKNKPVKNTDPVQEELRKLNIENQGLRLELLRQRFLPGTAVDQPLPEDEVGRLLQREDVKTFLGTVMKRLREDVTNAAELVAQQQQQQQLYQRQQLAAAATVPLLSTPRRLSVMPPPAPPLSSAGPGGTRPRMQPLSSAAEANVEEAVGQFLDGEEEIIDPEEDVRIINKLLEIIKQDQEFDETDRESQVKIGGVEKEIAEQEALLGTLKRNMSHYQALIHENDQLLKDLGSLEHEKHTLTAMLEENAKAMQQQQKGGGRKSAKSTEREVQLKDKLKQVEGKFKQLQAEQRRKEHAVKLVKQDSARVQQLQQSIGTLKKSKADMVRKQKDSAARFKTVMDTKNKELSDIRKRSRRDKLEASKLQHENRKLQTAVLRKAKAHQKTEEALRRNKEHLMKLLALKKRERMRQSVSKIAKRKRRQRRETIEQQAKGRAAGAPAEAAAATGAMEEADPWAAEDEKIRGTKFCLLELVRERVQRQQRQELEEKLQSEYDTLQKQILVEVGTLNTLKDECLEEGAEEGSDAALQVVEQEQRLEELVVKLEGVTASLADVHLPAKATASRTDEDSSEDGEEEARELSLVSEMPAPALRTVLWSLLDEQTDLCVALETSRAHSKQQAMALAAAVERAHRAEQHAKDLQRHFHEKLRGAEKKRLDYAHAVCSPVKKMPGKADAMEALNAHLKEKLTEMDRAQSDLREEKDTLARRATEFQERAMVAEQALEDLHASSEVAGLIQHLQGVWGEIGANDQGRESTLETIRAATVRQAREELDGAKRRKCALEAQCKRFEEEIYFRNLLLGNQAMDMEPPACRSLSERCEDLASRWRDLDGATAAAVQRIGEAQRKAEAFHHLLEVESPSGRADQDMLAQTLRLPPPPTDGAAPGLEWFTAAAEVLAGQVTAQRVEDMEGAARRAAVRLAELTAECDSSVLAARGHLSTMGLLEPSHSLAVENLLAQQGLTSGAGATDVLGVVQELLPTAGVVAPSSRRVELRTAAERVCQCLAAHAVARSDAAKTAQKLLRDSMEAVFLRLCQKHGLPTGDEEGDENLGAVEGSLAETVLADLVHEIVRCLKLTKQELAETQGRLEALWETGRGTAAEQEAFSRDWAGVEEKRSQLQVSQDSPAAAELAAMANVLAPRRGTMVEAGQPEHEEGASGATGALPPHHAPSTEWFAALAGSLGSAAAEARWLREAMECLERHRGRVHAREELEAAVLRLDQDLNDFYNKSSEFESSCKDPTRLLDRTGKGRRVLDQEEKSRREYKRVIEKCLSELQQVLLKWEERERSPFPAKKLSDRAQVVLKNLKRDSCVTSLTQLMHLESSMYVGNQRVPGSSKRSRETADGDSQPGSPGSEGHSPREVAKAGSAAASGASGGGAVSPKRTDPSTAQGPPRAVQAPVVPAPHPRKTQNPFAKMVTSRKAAGGKAAVAAAPRTLMDHTVTSGARVSAGAEGVASTLEDRENRGSRENIILNGQPEQGARGD